MCDFIMSIQYLVFQGQRDTFGTHIRITFNRIFFSVIFIFIGAQKPERNAVTRNKVIYRLMFTSLLDEVPGKLSV